MQLYFQIQAILYVQTIYKIGKDSISLMSTKSKRNVLCTPNLPNVVHFSECVWNKYCLYDMLFEILNDFTKMDLSVFSISLPEYF